MDTPSVFLTNLFSPELHVPQSLVCSVFSKRLNPYLISSSSSGTIPLIYPLTSSLLPAVTALLDRTPLSTVPTHTQLQSPPQEVPGVVLGTNFRCSHSFFGLAVLWVKGIWDQVFHHTSSGLLRLTFQTVLTCPILDRFFRHQC